MERFRCCATVPAVQPQVRWRVLRPRAARLAATAVAALVAAGLAGCASGTATPGGAAPTTAPPAPAARIDPNANGVITGPINEARRLGNQVDQQQNQEQQVPAGP